MLDKASIAGGGKSAAGPSFARIDREWQGETAFIVGGGPSVLQQNLNALRGRRVVAINSSYAIVPFADFLLFGDLRWWRIHHPRLTKFPGRIVTCRRTPGALNGFKREVLELERKDPPGLSLRPTTLSFKRTSYTPAFNILVHLGVVDIVALGLDGKPDAKGLTHHHAPHPWPTKRDCWAKQAEELGSLVKPLSDLGIRVRNASPGSVYDFWPHVNLESCL